MIMQSVSYLFYLVIIVLVLTKRWEYRKLGLERRLVIADLSFNLLFFSFVSYITVFWGYTNVFDAFCVLLCLFIVSQTPEPLNSSGKYFLFYFIFLIWCTFTLCYSTNIEKGVMMILKLSLPLFYYAIACRAFKTSDSIWFFLEQISKLSIAYFLCCLIARFSNGAFQIYSYFGMYVLVSSLTLFLRNKKRVYILYMFLSFSYLIVEPKRTPLLGALLIIIVALLYLYRFKALVPIVLSIVGFVCMVLFIPSISSYMFFEGFDVHSIDYEAFFDGTAFEMINTHGRNDIWSVIYNHFFLENKWVGAGLGTVKGWLLSPENYTGSFELLHNDWLHLLCETGLIGMSFLMFFYIGLFKKTIKCFYSKRSYDTRLLALSLACVTVGTMVHMFFENSLGGFGYSIPFLYSCFFIKSNEFDKLKS